MKNLALALCLAAAMGAGAGVARAADTVETFGPGASDLELYVTSSGAGKPADQRHLSGQITLGFGLTDRLSAQLNLSGEANDALGEGNGGYAFGVFGTWLETEHLDLDLGLDLGTDNHGAGAAHPFNHNTGEFYLFPWLELNLDSQNDLSGFGAYLNAGEVISGEDKTWMGHDGLERRGFETHYALELSAGLYLAPAPGHQFFLAYNTVFNHDPDDDRPATEIGGVSLGYNFMVAQNLELITETLYDIPQHNEDPGFNFLIGLIATLP